MRKTILNESVPVFEEAVTLKVYTKSPHKYLLVDLETGQLYRGQVDESRDWFLIGGEQKQTLLGKLWSALGLRQR